MCLGSLLKRSVERFQVLSWSQLPGLSQGHTAPGIAPLRLLKTDVWSEKHVT